MTNGLAARIRKAGSQYYALTLLLLNNFTAEKGVLKRLPDDRL
jgi:hypothetical protein